MANTFDTLHYTKILEESGVERKQAEAHATATRSLVVSDLVTKEDLRQRLDLFETRLTIKLGGIVAGVMAFAFTLEKFFA
ncbi:hypothetical protein [Roseibium alexandrii]|uniref:hypothetical protein n=1 Tax=Roseibium alexandrii TaxID=388408 RepID=UPI00375250BF